METAALEVNPEVPDPEVIRRAGELIRHGGLVAFPTETVYGLAADAFNVQAVARVFEVKGRPADNPLPVQIASRDDASMLAAEIPDSARKLMDAFFPGPLTIVLHASPRLPRLVTAGTGKVGIRMPDHPVAIALIRQTGRPIVAPSANVSGQPPPTTAEEVLAHLGGKIDMVLDAGPSRLGIASTVIDLTESPPRVLRVGSLTEDMLAPYL
jgi:L-threonylcarbamoyladenylate synthase